MRLLGVIILLAAFTFPVVSQAAEISDCATGSIRCYCPPDISIADYDQNTLVAGNEIESCIEGCRALDYVVDIENWVIQCSIDSEQKVVASNLIDLDNGTPVPEELPDAIVPALGVAIPGLKFTSPTSSGGYIAVNFLGEYISAMYAWLIGAGAILAVVMIMIGGLEWMLARGNSAGVGKAKTRITNAFSGMVLLLFAYTIAFFIDPNTVIFRTLEIKHVKGIDFIPNETALDFPIVGQGVISSEAAAGGVGWNGFLIYDQTQYGLVPYGHDPAGCFKPAVFDTNGKRTSNGSGNLLSSGCGVTSFASVISTIGSQGHQTPDMVGDTFYAEGHRPIGSDGCGFNGTFGAAFSESSLLAKNNLVGENIPIGGVGQASAEARAQIIAHLQHNPIEPVIVAYQTESGGGHYVVLVGVEGNNFLYNNPWGGTKQIRNIEEFFSVIKFAAVIKQAE